MSAALMCSYKQLINDNRILIYDVMDAYTLAEFNVSYRKCLANNSSKIKTE